MSFRFINATLFPDFFFQVKIHKWVYTNVFFLNYQHFFLNVFKFDLLIAPRESAIWKWRGEDRSAVPRAKIFARPSFCWLFLSLALSRDSNTSTKSMICKNLITKKRSSRFYLEFMICKSRTVVNQKKCNFSFEDVITRLNAHFSIKFCINKDWDNQTSNFKNHQGKILISF